MSQYTITINGGDLIAGQLADVQAAIGKVMVYLDQFLDWNGTIDIGVNVRTHAQAIIEDYSYRYGDPAQYPNGLLPSIVAFTGTGDAERTVALNEAITGIDANDDSFDAGFTIYLGQDGTIRNYGIPTSFEDGEAYETWDPVPAGTFDFASVALHEILHGFGFAVGGGLFRSFIEDGVFLSDQVFALLGEGLPFQAGGDHYGNPDFWDSGADTYQFREGPVQSGAMFTAGDYEQNRWTIGGVDLAVLQTLGWNVTHEGPIQLVDTADALRRQLGDEADIHQGVAGSESIYSGGGDDVIVLSRLGEEAWNGNDFVDGGTGRDSVVYAGARTDYGLHQIQGMTVVRSVAEDPGIDGTDALVSVERLEFADGALLFDLDSANLPFVYRIYAAAFGRAPDEAGLIFWTDQLDSRTDGPPAAEDREFLASFFLTADEFTDLYGENPTDEEYIAAMYQNVLKRDPDQPGYEYWLDQMQNNGQGSDDILIFFCESDENVENTAPYLDDGVWVV